MANKIAGIDVHKKVLMVVVLDGAAPWGEARAAAIFHHAHGVAPSGDMAAGTRCGGSGNGIDRAILAIGVAGTRAAHEFAPRQFLKLRPHSNYGWSGRRPERHRYGLLNL
jgi:hypothetical protein